MEMNEIIEIMARHLRLSEASATIAKAEKSIVVDAPTDTVLVYQTGEDGSVGVSAVWKVREGRKFHPFIDDSNPAVMKVMKNGRIERKLRRIPEVKLKRRIA